MNSAPDTKMQLFEKTGDDISPFASATPDELLVTGILLELENLFQFQRFQWGFSKRRSCLDAPPTDVQIAGEEEVEFRGPLVEAEEEVASAAAANTASSSPATLLSFPSSESDGNSPPPSSKKILNKRSRADISDTFEELTHQGNLLRVVSEEMGGKCGEAIERVEGPEFRLKSNEQEALKTQQSKEEAERGKDRYLNLGMSFIQHDETIMLPHRQPLVDDLTAQRPHHPLGPIRTQVHPANNGLESVNGVGVDSTQPLDVIQGIADRRAKQAESRRVRMGKIRSRKSGSGTELPPTT